MSRSWWLFLGDIGEAAKAIPADVRELHPQVDWKGMAGLRDVLAHAYFGLDDATLWDVVTTKVPELRDQVRPDPR